MVAVLGAINQAGGAEQLDVLDALLRAPVGGLGGGDVHFDDFAGMDFAAVRRGGSDAQHRRRFVVGKRVLKGELVVSRLVDDEFVPEIRAREVRSAR
jgi:hypothetical protein